MEEEDEEEEKYQEEEKEVLEAGVGRALEWPTVFFPVGDANGSREERANLTIKTLLWPYEHSAGLWRRRACTRVFGLLWALFGSSWGYLGCSFRPRSPRELFSGPS